MDTNPWAKEILEAGMLDDTWKRMRIALETGTAVDKDSNYMLEDRLVCFK